MSQHPQRNEDRFYRYPMNRIVAVLDDDERLRAVLDELSETEVEPSAVNVLSGPEGAERLDRSGVRHGLRGRVLRLLQRTAYEGAALDAHEAALKKGGHVIYVPVGSDAQRDTVVRLLRASGGRYLLHFHRWTVEETRFARSLNRTRPFRSGTIPRSVSWCTRYTLAAPS